jgi:DNA-directed RNA polymerase I and III subunit RPAC1
MTNNQIKSNLVYLEADHVNNVSNMDYPGAFYGQSNDFDFGKFKETLEIKINFISPLEMGFDIIHVDASLANALRRIMISEVPTMALEKVFIINNTGVVMGEILSHRLGLCVIKAAPEMFQDYESGQQATDLNTLVFKLKSKGSDGCTTSVLASDILWHPQFEQLKRLNEFINSSRPCCFFEDHWKNEAESYSEKVKITSKHQTHVRHSIRLLYPDTLIAKLKPRQEIECEIHAVKGQGKDHAKFSPVSACSYRLLPSIIIPRPIIGAAAEKFEKCFEKGVIGLRINKNGEKEAFVDNPRNCYMSRECLRHKEFEDVKLAKVRDHFIFTIESLGQYDSPCEIFITACKILSKKCVVLKEAVRNLQTKSEN